MASTSAKSADISATTSGSSTPRSDWNTMLPPKALPEPGKYSLSTAKPLVLSDSGVENSPENAAPITPAIALIPNNKTIQAAMTSRPRRNAQRASEEYMSLQQLSWGVCHECGHIVLTPHEADSIPTDVVTIATLRFGRAASCQWCARLTM